VVFPALSVGLVSARFIPWHDYFINLFRTFSLYLIYFDQSQHIIFLILVAQYFKHSREHLNRKLDQAENMDDDEIKNDEQFLSTIRRIVGGLFLPTAAVALDRLVLRKICADKPVLTRTVIVRLF
jgi:hypothetical protein